MIKHSVLGVFLAKAQDIAELTEATTAEVPVGAPLGADATPEEKIAAFENSLKNVFVEYGMAENVFQAKEIALGQIDVLEKGDIYDKVGVLSEIVDPITSNLADVNGTDFVNTMSEEAVEFYADAAAYLAEEGNFTAYNSIKWGTKIPKRTDPTNAVKCAA